MSAIADFKRNGGRKTFGTGLPAPSEEPPRLNFAQNERSSLRYWPAYSVPIGRENGVLYRKFESEDGKTFRWQLVLPRSRIPEVLKELHGSPTGGHFGVMKTLH
ncbi:retrovirus-related Pol polyprotein from transposon 412 [Trichonephila clavipes]|nr:retrovirus-related Pol polyprotein from transposon 412 [Trichonephila clavipes]